MKILESELVIRHHIEFDEEETAFLKKIGDLPPHAAPRARLWLTEAEIPWWDNELKELRS